MKRELLVFLLFLCVSAVFWLMLALNETYSEEIEVPVRLTGIPAGVALISNAEDTVRVTMRDKGYFILSYMYGNVIKGVDADYSTYVKTSDCARITATEIQKIIVPQLYATSTVVSVKPDKVEFFYTKGESKSVPVEVAGKIQAAANYYIAKVSIEPEMVSAYAAESKIDSITVALTEQLDYTNLTDTMALDVSLNRTEGVKYVPSTVRVTIYPDVLIEETAEVPVTTVNLPEDKVLRTFPSKATVAFTIGAGAYRMLDTGSFVVEADYADIVANPTEKCRLTLRSQPEEVRSASLRTTLVDYLIEER